MENRRVYRGSDTTPIPRGRSQCISESFGTTCMRQHGRTAIRLGEAKMFTRSITSPVLTNTFTTRTLSRDAFEIANLLARLAVQSRCQCRLCLCCSAQCRCLYMYRVSQKIRSCRRAAATICHRPSPAPVGVEAPRAVEQTAT